MRHEDLAVFEPFALIESEGGLHALLGDEPVGRIEGLEDTPVPVGPASRGEEAPLQKGAENGVGDESLGQ